jgi:hypothetical protein
VRDDRVEGGPPDEAYGRVTRPERFAVLHEAADALVEELAARYDVAVSTDVPLPADLGERGPDLVRTVRLDPAGGGAPIVIGFTAFPGLVLRCGRWYDDLVPACGCDACDDDPAELADELTRRVSSIAAHGLREQRVFRRRGLTRGVQQEFLIGGAASGQRWSSIDNASARRRPDALGTGAVDWPPWRPAE